MFAPLRGGLLVALLSVTVQAQEAWPGALARMPLAPGVHALNRTNCVSVMLGAFRSNAVLKGLVFMPGATDEFYFFKRAHATMVQPEPTLADAVAALTNQTRIRARFCPPLLLLHTEFDPAAAQANVLDPRTAAKLRAEPFLPYARYNDRDWDFLLPILHKTLRVTFLPRRLTPGSWDFYRHSFVGYNLTGWEALEAVALAGRTTFTVERKRVTFVADTRHEEPTRP